MVQLLLIFGKRTFLVGEWGAQGFFSYQSRRRSRRRFIRRRPSSLLRRTCCLEGGRKLHWERTFSSEKEMEKRGFFGKLVDVVIGEPEHPHLIRPYSIAVDSRGRAIVTDPGAKAFTSSIWKGTSTNSSSAATRTRIPCARRSASPWTRRTTIYVTDSEAGKIFVFDSSGKFKRTIGSLKGGEGFFKRPTGIAVDSAADRIYVTDTLRDKIFMMDMNGSVLQIIGKKGTGEGEFNLPTEVLVRERICLSSMR